MADKIKKPKKTSTIKWLILFGGTAIVDIFQIVADLTGFGIAISEAIEPFVGAGIIVVCQVMKIDVITKSKRVASLLAALGLDAITGGFAPFWTADIWYIYHDTRKEEKAAQAAFDKEQEDRNMLEMPMYMDGIRQARDESADFESDEGDDTYQSARNPNTRPLVVDGIRAPSK